tara:strand:+ start:138 stop:1013 length:876 start_codon:yes stop_codon:yes gene_type:complete
MNVRDRIMYFSTGDGANASGEAYAAPVNKLRRILPVSTTTLDLVFESNMGGLDTVRLTIATNKHKEVINSINNKLMGLARPGSMIVVCDSDNSVFVDSNISDCVIYLGRSSSNFNGQNITGTSKALVSTIGGDFDSISLASVHGSNAATIDLYYASQVGTDITATDVVAAEAEAASTSSVTLTVDNGSGSASDASDDELLSEKIYKSDGTLFGTCTTVTDTTTLVFSGGLSNAIANNDVLYTGTRYYVLKAVSLAVGHTLILDRNDINFNSIDYSLYIKLGAGSIDLITRQ